MRFHKACSAPGQSVQHADCSGLKRSPRHASGDRHTHVFLNTHTHTLTHTHTHSVLESTHFGYAVGALAAAAAVVAQDAPVADSNDRWDAAAAAAAACLATVACVQVLGTATVFNMGYSESRASVFQCFHRSRASVPKRRRFRQACDSCSSHVCSWIVE